MIGRGRDQPLTIDRKMTQVKVIASLTKKGNENQSFFLGNGVEVDQKSQSIKELEYIPLTYKDR